MSARQSATAPNSKPSQFRNVPGRIAGSLLRGQDSGAHSENGRFRPAVDLRLPLFDCRFGWGLGAGRKEHSGFRITKEVTSCM